jgi:hypothetical protein
MLTGLTQTGGFAIGVWAPTLLVLVPGGANRRQLTGIGTGRYQWDTSWSPAPLPQRREQPEQTGDRPDSCRPALGDADILDVMIGGSSVHRCQTANQ